jgi:hypothetical protein
LRAQFCYLRTQPLELGPLVRAQVNIVRHSRTALLVATMAPSPEEMVEVITHIG